MNKGFPKIHHQVDFCVVGGGVSGLIAVISAARHGLKVVLMQDGPVLRAKPSRLYAFYVE
jgi:succinate dehydrogenase/fumarate reductase flavoprotein subunit